MEFLFCVLLSILFSAIIFCVYKLIRIQAVCDMRLKINHECFKFSLRRIDEGRYEQSQLARKEVWDKLPSYEKMLASFKPMRLSAWLTKQQIELLYS